MQQEPKHFIELNGKNCSGTTHLSYAFNVNFEFYYASIPYYGQPLTILLKVNKNPGFNCKFNIKRF